MQFSYTRLTDKHLGETQLEDLQARVKFANDAGADFFVSIHQNVDAQRKGYGVETSYYSNSSYSSVEGRKLAAALQASVVRNTDLYDRCQGKWDGARPARFYVIRYTNMTAVLVEAGFVGGDPDEAEYVSRPETISKIADGILMGIADYLDIKYAPVPVADPLADAVKVLQDAGVINSPDYWLQNARKGQQCNGEYAGSLIQKFAKKLKPDN